MVRHILGERPGYSIGILGSNADKFVGWGRKWSGRRAVEIAQSHGAKFLLLEDGFLRSVGRQDRSLSVVIDDMGVHYDASKLSRLEQLISSDITPVQADRARKIMQLWREGRVSKYNAAPELSRELPKKYVLVIDQVRGDMSINYGAASAESFERMLARAQEDNPNSDIVVKLHPDVYTNAAKSHFDPVKLGKMERVHVVAENCHPISLIEGAQSIYAVTSQVGFEALIWGKPVHVFGMPFYAGWGLTQDDQIAPDRRGRASLEQLVHAALVAYPEYVDPSSKASWEPEQAIAHVAEQRRLRLGLPEEITAVGFSIWKRGFIPKFLAGSDVSFAKHAKPNANVAIWGRTDAPDSAASVLRIEDGFLRSAGLGADLIPPMSLVVDRCGIYYDATGPSDLENMLNLIQLNTDQQARAGRLRELIVESGISKYNTGDQNWRRPDTTKPVILVVGQVESDASLAFGSPKVKTDIALLQQTRAQEPDAYIVYKPHPDVLAGLRDLGRNIDEASAYCDEILRDNVAPDHLLGQIDALHTMTSLMGFEALLREIPVTCHGIPFYAGWGLTTDMLLCDRRKRKLSLQELIYGALIAYPRYFDFDANCFVGPERALEILAKQRENQSDANWYRKLRRLLIVSVLKLRGAKK
ncbi:capsular polysaccharide biosynthesis protein [Loktanella sp. S4079]|uniref:capsular polysaccharide biosynthesis protein n=1 Tax=Loktanella sp. S4079 TaxID=579483 RepID=UPI0005F9E162|nr:capsular polysaccharide biosynthesis protein [Loktanella sp. S4079]